MYFFSFNFIDWDITITTSCVHAVQRPLPQKCPRSSPTSVTKPSPAILATLDDLWIWVTPRHTTTLPGSFPNWKIHSFTEKSFEHSRTNTYLSVSFPNWKIHHFYLKSLEHQRSYTSTSQLIMNTNNSRLLKWKSFTINLNILSITLHDRH